MRVFAVDRSVLPFHTLNKQTQHHQRKKPEQNMIIGSSSPYHKLFIVSRTYQRCSPHHIFSVLVWCETDLRDLFHM